ncbi:MAG: SDR family oxidoreductase [Deltaproteobacteria bacterium]|nr:MAG: SDR family oxidoreductase [Deltaproteobacteria bacterium]
MKLKDKVAIVTGASRGIGRGIALCLAEAGADVVVASRTVEEKEYMPGTIHSVAKEVRALGRRALPLQVDVAQEEQVQDMVQKTIDEFEKIDILVNNAGMVLAIKSLWEVTKEEWDAIVAVDLTGTFLCCKYVIPHMIKREYGKIINMGSIQGRQGLRGQVPYGACKAAIHNYTLALAKDVSMYNINVNAVGPGAVRTYLVESVFHMAMPEDQKDLIFDQLYQNYSLFGREVTSEDIGNAVVFLASEDAKNINGQTLFIDGGQPLKGE